MYQLACDVHWLQLSKGVPESVLSKKNIKTIREQEYTHNK
jgi:hypothetical protein